MPTRLSNLTLSAVLIFAFASPGFAQGTTTMTTNPTYELSAGYQYLHMPDMSFPFGLAVDAAKHYGNLGLVGDVGWSRRSNDDLDDSSTNMFHFAAGPRWTRMGVGRAWPYAQVLVGAAVGRTGFGDTAGVDDSDTDAAFMLQPGVGVTMVSGDGWGVFGQFDYRRTFFDEPDDTDNSINNQFRVYFGLRMILD